MLKIKAIFIFLVLGNSLTCAMDNSTVMFVGPVYNPLQNVLNGMGIYSSTITSAYSEKKTFHHKRSKMYAVTKVDYPVSKTDFLNQAAEREVRSIEQKAKIMSDYIDQKYVGEGDNWSIMNQLAVCLGLNGLGDSATESVVKDLTDIYNYFEYSRWNSHIISSLVCPHSNVHNKRVYGLMNRLVSEKMIKYRLHISSILPVITRASIKGSTIDEFFDEEFLFPGLPKPFQKFIQYVVEEKYRYNHMAGDKSQAIVFHVLLTALHNSRNDPQELSALLKSSIFKKHEKDTNFAFTAYVRKNSDWCSWFPWICDKQK